MKLTVAAMLLTACAFSFAQDAPSCPMHAQHATQSPSHDAAVDERGDHAMGFSHEASTHHFRLLSDGGAIEVNANKPDDTATREQIRTHLSNLAERFASGNFDAPSFIHDTNPPGVDVMKAKGSAVSYLYEPMPNGGAVRIRTSDPVALEAIHQFLRFQIKEHRTGDPTTIATDEGSMGN
jgi:hypothetical protein